MKNFLVAVLAIGCAAILFTGYLHWKDKTVVSTTKVNQEMEKSKTEETKSTKKSSQSLEDLTANWPKQAREQYKQALEAGEPFHLLIAGSNALGYEEDGWSVQLKSELEDAFGDTIHVAVKSYDLTSAQFILENKLDELVEENPDLTLLEPFTLNDNGNVQFADSHLQIKEIAAGLLEANPEHVLILQPPYPLHQARNYPVEVAALKEFAEEHDIPYLDHWTAWPDPDSDEILEYLREEDDSTYVNESGHQLWASYLIDYFIAK